MILDRTRIYQINLDHRTDRWDECIRNHQAMGFQDGDIRRVSACIDAQFGLIGCTKSHIKAMTEFFITENAEYCLVLEDDFDFLIPRQELEARLDLVAQKAPDFDVIMLSGTHVLSLGVGLPLVEKVMDAQSACAYLLKRDYVPKLLACFLNSARKLEIYREHTAARGAFTYWYGLDMMWKHLQREDKWYIFNPVLGVQRPSFSDIEGKHTDYSNAFRHPSTQG